MVVKQPEEDWEVPLSGILAIAIAVAIVSTFVGVIYLDLSLLAGLLLYSASGTAVLFFVAWRRYRCMEFHADHAKQG